MKRLISPLLASFAIHIAAIAMIFGAGRLLTSGDDLPLSGSGGGGSVTIEIVGDGGSGGTEKKKEIRNPEVSSERTEAKEVKEKMPPAHEKSRKAPGSPSVAMAGPGTGPGGPGSGAGPSGGTNSILAEIRARIERAKHYPLLLRKSGVQGVSLVSFRINAQGQPEDIALKTSSGSSALDEEALSTIKRAAPYPVYDDALTIGIHFELRD